MYKTSLILRDNYLRGVIHMALHVGNVRPGNLPSGRSRGPCGERRMPRADKVLKAQSPLLTQNIQGCRPEEQTTSFSACHAHLKGAGQRPSSNVCLAVPFLIKSPLCARQLHTPELPANPTQLRESEWGVLVSY